MIGGFGGLFDWEKYRMCIQSSSVLTTLRPRYSLYSQAVPKITRQTPQTPQGSQTQQVTEAGLSLPPRSKPAELTEQTSM
jgi:hypothetical protein